MVLCHSKDKIYVLETDLIDNRACFVLIRHCGGASILDGDGTSGYFPKKYPLVLLISRNRPFYKAP